LNVVIHRLPKMLDREWREQCTLLLDPDQEPTPLPTYNLVTPGSRCPGCNNPIRPWENIPVLSWIFLRAKCSACGTRISARYPIVELTAALLGVVVANHFG